MRGSVVLTEAPNAWKYLNGLFCVYKPVDVSVNGVRAAIITNLCRTLNELKPRPVADFVEIDGPVDNLGVKIRTDYSDHPLVVGPRYQPEDVKINYALMLGRRTSGVLGVNGGTKTCMKFTASRSLRTYLVKGKLGQATDNMYTDGKVVEKASFSHVQRHHLEKVLATFQAAHQKQMFLHSGVDMQSQTAYELAVKGMLRPTTKNTPFIYNFRCTHFEPPNPEFTIEIESINENEDYLISVIHDIGARLRTLATCTGLQCIRHGCFTAYHALLRKHWTTQHILSNIAQCQQVMKETDFKLEHQPFLVEKEEAKENIV